MLKKYILNQYYLMKEYQIFINENTDLETIYFNYYKAFN